MANSIALTILQRPTDGQPLATPITRNVSAANIIYFVADTTAAPGSTARVYMKFGKNNGQTTGIYVVSNNFSTSLVATLTGFVSLTVYNGELGNVQPTVAAPASQTVYYNPIVIQDFFTDTASGFTGVNSQINAVFPVGNGTTTNYLLVAQTTAALATALTVAGGSAVSVGQTALVAGTKAITIAGLTTTSKAFVSLVSQAGTTTTTDDLSGACTTNTLTISAVTNAGTNTVNTGDTSVVNYIVYQ